MVPTPGLDSHVEQLPRDHLASDFPVTRPKVNVTCGVGLDGFTHRVPHLAIAIAAGIWDRHAHAEAIVQDVAGSHRSTLARSAAVALVARARTCSTSYYIDRAEQLQFR